MVDNFICENCSKYSVCRNVDIISKFQVEAKKPLGINITIDKCFNYDDNSDNIEEDGGNPE